MLADVGLDRILDTFDSRAPKGLSGYYRNCRCVNAAGGSSTREL
jgi:hypothetical protein